MTLLRWAGALALALIPSYALAQTLPPIVAPSTIVPPSGQAFRDGSGATVLVSPTSPLPVAPPSTSAATSTPVTGSTSATMTAGPLTPQLGRPIRVVVKLTAGASYSAQVFTSPDACTTLNPLTIGGQVWASFAGMTRTINEDVDIPMLSGITYCLTLTPASGATVSYALRQ